MSVHTYTGTQVRQKALIYLIIIWVFSFLEQFNFLTA